MSKFYIYTLVLVLIVCYINPSLGYSQDNIRIFKLALAEPNGEIDRKLGEPLILNLHDSSAAPKKFHARLFRGTVAQFRKFPTDAQGCVQFHTVVLPVTVSGVIQMRSLDDPGWLSPVKDGFESQKYTIVFESGDQPSDSTIRISSKEVDKYFKYSVEINLVPPEDLKHAVKKTVDAARTSLYKRAEQFQKITASVCWGVTLNANTDPPYLNAIVQVAELTPCKMNPALPITGDLFACLFTPTSNVSRSEELNLK
jgi:hypothetical protein